MGFFNTLRDILGMNQEPMEEDRDLNMEEYGDLDEVSIFNEFDDKRVNWNPSMVHPGDEVQVFYQGLLNQDGAQNVYLHYGFDHWRQPIQSVPMTKQPDGGFAAAIRADGNLEINLCFVDPGGNWDNNNKLNWTINIDS